MYNTLFERIGKRKTLKFIDFFNAGSKLLHIWLWNKSKTRWSRNFSNFDRTRRIIEENLCSLD